MLQDLVKAVPFLWKNLVIYNEGDNFLQTSGPKHTNI